jgi:hypothetical protein
MKAYGLAQSKLWPMTDWPLKDKLNINNMNIEKRKQQVAALEALF